MLNAMQAAIAPWSAEIGLAVLVILFTTFVTERFAPVVVAVAGTVVMMALGFLPRADVLGVFSNPAPITIGAMFVLSGALLRTGALEEVAGWVIRRTMRKPRLALGEIAGGTMLASAFMNNTPVVIVMIPIVRRLARVLNVAATRLLIPLSYISILGGTLTLIGTSTNLLVAGVWQEQGRAPFGIFDITPIGFVAAATGVLVLLVLGPLLLPDRRAATESDERESDLYLSHLVLEADSKLIGKRLAECGISRRAGIRIIAAQRGTAKTRRDLGEWVLAAGDQLVVAANPTELASLAEAPDFRTGLASVGGGVVTAGPRRPADLQLVQAVISPSHPVIGRRLAEIPLLSRIRVRVLGLSRPRHVAGPDLANVRVRAGDRLLIAAGNDAALALRTNVNLADVGGAKVRAFRRARAPIAILTLAGVVAGAAMLGLPIEVLALAGVGLVLLTRCLEPEEAWSSIDGNTLVLIFGMLAVGRGLENAGTVDLLVAAVAPLLGAASPLLLLIAVYAVTSLLTETVTNNAVAVIVTPIAIGLAEAAGMDPRALVVAVMFGASASFATPIGYQTNTLVYGAANYRFADFLKIGVPMNIIVGLATCVAIEMLM
ncbi:SLC13 family permease [Erythrobacteraceae bacterium CFH 75059]|uniref:SLC13 family permease n=1 Tax=Qipengyuania thermophila TaxID=2509361 RepID=UPI0010228AD6|nr:SLC13 family permease [Qipengyuania thermophila]TCD05525.1 SLC13 family permease [Erythrobacteraceae bacterium CFH 75059]